MANRPRSSDLPLRRLLAQLPGVRTDPALPARILSALILAPVVLALIGLGVWWFELLLVAGLLLLAREWTRLTAAQAGAAGRADLAGGSAALVGLAALAIAAADQWLPAVATVGVGALGAALIASLHGGAARWIGFGVLYLGLPTVALAWLRALPEIGLGLLVWLFLVVWATDICAYIAGRTIGGPRLAPRISPGKTWAGLLGGMAGAGLCGGLVTAIGAPDKALPAAGLGLLLAVVAQLGDLLQSRLKRQAGLKDSGRLIPGHGGLLDRVDGLLAAASALALLGWLLGPGALPWR